ncbi:MAG: hypothetical protein OEZ58_21575 [Gammaproteobacteria bacterium]|nr:hypothetical protein [Gammaproteobacteria bacterium]MDH5731584.1 hypothetical protein [Gammaproteobacteria bacterium]
MILWLATDISKTGQIIPDTNVSCGSSAQNGLWTHNYAPVKYRDANVGNPLNAYHDRDGVMVEIWLRGR